ncbi:GNAT family N-acetyltransferase [Aliikangiella sp. IMCC44359]|uniref:GNAT family N-acetyltransferase n=1 Tax=Aliikangiella sp. IMCC44359 TaxID=3459125 RepID=UPI00403B2BBE
MQYKIIRKIEALDEYAEQYDAFLDKHLPDELVYYRRGHLKAVIPWLSTLVEVCIVLVFKDNDEIIGVAPFQVIKRHPLYLKNKRLQFLGTKSHLLCASYGGIVANSATGLSQVISESLAKAMNDEQFVQWDEYYFENAYTGSNLGIWESALGSSLQVIENHSVCHRTDVSIDIDDFIKSTLKRKVRGELKRATKAINSELPANSFKIATEMSDELFNKIACVHSERQKVKRDVGDLERQSLFDSAEEVQACRDLLKWASEEKRLRCYYLEDEGELIAFKLCINHNQITHVLIIGFNPKYSRFSPSKLLAIKMFEAEKEQYQTTNVDFLADTNLFKKQLAPIIVKRFIYFGFNQNKLSSRIRWLLIKLTTKLINLIKR